MNYLQSITDFFKSPKWLMNLLLAGLCSFIPVVGAMVVFGWLLTGFWGRRESAPETFPDFDFSNFGKWLERGLWPMLVALVTTMGLYVIFMIPMFLIMGLAGAAIGSTQGRGAPGLMGGRGVLIIIGMEVILLLVMVFVLKPLMLRAALTQEFIKAFDLRFIQQFVALTWLELLLSVLFMLVASWILSLVGFLAFCVGIFLVPGLVYFMMVHLDQQLYRLYLSRGGEAIAISPKLSDSLMGADPLNLKP